MYYHNLKEEKSTYILIYFLNLKTISQIHNKQFKIILGAMPILIIQSNNPSRGKIYEIKYGRQNQI